MKIGIKIQPFNFRMREERMSRGLTQKELAEAVGVGTGLVSEIERLVVPAASMARVRDALNKIAFELELPFDDLFPVDYLKAIEKSKLPRRIKAMEKAGFTLPKRRSSFIWCFERNLDQLLGQEGLLALPSAEEEAEINLSKVELKTAIDGLLNLVTPRERQILEMRFGMTQAGEMTYEEVGKRVGVTRERVRQIEGHALRKLRHPTRSGELRDYA